MEKNENRYTYSDLMREAEDYYNRIAANSPFCAMFDARRFICERIDLCVDRSEHLDILEWEEYKQFKPMTKEEYNRKKENAKKEYEDALKRIEDEWNEKGKNSPDFHKL